MSGKIVLADLGVLVVVAEVVGWVAGHVWELLAVTAACGALVVAAVVALSRWAERRRSGSHSGSGICIHLDGVPAAERAAVIRQALTGGSD